MEDAARHVREGKSLDDQRRYPRRPLLLEVGIEDPQGNVIGGRSRDLSLGGMFIEIDSTLPFGTALTLTVDLAGIGPSSLPAVVRWVKPDGMGVQFGLLGARQTAAITDMVRSADGEPSTKRRPS